MKNNKGFTLTELLASLVILSIISLIAIPSVLHITNKNKKESFINDAQRLVSIAKYEANKDAKKKSYLENDRLIFYGGLEVCVEDNCITSNDIETSPNGEKYTSGYIKYNSDKTYEVCLTDEKNTVKGNSSNLTIDNVYEYEKENCG